MHSTHTFAELTGVTVKALRHYERVGLLAPRRTRARYRRYAFGDLQRLERILALKSLGLSLKAIKTVLKRGGIELRAHRASLVEKRVRLDRAIAALEEIEQDTRPRAAIQRFVGEASWDRWETKRRSLAVDRPPDRAPASALALFREIAAALDADGAGHLGARGRLHGRSGLQMITHRHRPFSDGVGGDRRRQVACIACVQERVHSGDLAG
jgi:DNA-binding transcriptional MerR regulator